MAGIAHHPFLRYRPSPMNLTFVVSSADVSFGNDHARIAHLKYNHGMGVIAYPQDISDFYVRKCKLTLCVHPGRQTAKCRIAEYKSEGYAAHGTDILPIKGSSMPTVISQ